MSSLVGRGPEIVAVRERLRGGRVVTLTGPGGCGKTRLALRVAMLAADGFEDGARLVELASLTDPALAGLPEDRSVRSVAESEAGALFVTRAAAASPGFALTTGNAAAVAEVCSRLDGMPLAIELAAARCPALGPEQLAARLEDHPGLLAGGAARPGRHRSLEALVAWSYDLLGEDERRLLARLSVLRGGFDLEVAEQERHARLAIELARTAAGQEGLVGALTMWSMPAISGAGIQSATVAALDEAATVLAAHPDRFAETILREWRAELFAALGQFDAAETEVGLCWAAGRSGAVRPVEFGGPLAEARLAVARGDTAAAAGALRRAADAGRRVGSVMFVPSALAGLACVAAIVGDEATAAAAVAEARTELGGRCQAITAAALGYAEGVMAWHRGELAHAEHLAREATVQWHRGGDRMDACDGIELLGVLAAARERFPDAARLLGAADAARRSLQYLAPRFTANRGAAARAASQARQILGDDRFTLTWEEGQELSLDDAVAYATRKGGGRKRPATGWASLTPAELQVARLVSEGLRNDAIARRLFITTGTVKVHLTHIFAKTGITTRTELAAQAAARDLTAGIPDRDRG